LIGLNKYNFERGNIMIDVKDAVKIAMDFVKNIYTGEKFDRVTLEEVELSDDSPFWYVTLGLGQVIQTDPFAVLSGGGKVSVKYKVFTIHRETGEVISMKIRQE
jgi:hypothetical protein